MHFPLHPAVEPGDPLLAPFLFPFHSKPSLFARAGLLSPDLHDPGSSPGHSCFLLEWVAVEGGLFSHRPCFPWPQERISGILVSHCHLQSRLFLSRQNAPGFEALAHWPSGTPFAEMTLFHAPIPPHPPRLHPSSIL